MRSATIILAALAIIAIAVATPAEAALYINNPYGPLKTAAYGTINNEYQWAAAAAQVVANPQTLLELKAAGTSDSITLLYYMNQLQLHVFNDTYYGTNIEPAINEASGFVTKGSYYLSSFKVDNNDILVFAIEKIGGGAIKVNIFRFNDGAVEELGYFVASFSGTNTIQIKTVNGVVSPAPYKKLTVEVEGEEWVVLPGVYRSPLGDVVEQLEVRGPGRPVAIDIIDNGYTELYAVKVGEGKLYLVGREAIVEVELDGKSGLSAFPAPVVPSLGSQLQLLALGAGALGLAAAAIYMIMKRG